MIFLKEWVDKTNYQIKATHQDDLFPPTRNLWKPTVTAAKWLAGEDGTQVTHMNLHLGQCHFDFNFYSPLTSS